jgi:AmmeMemoRadiSam system protein B
MMDYPKLRYVEAFPYEMSGQRVIGLRDPLHFTDKVLLVPYKAFFIISHFDGQHSLMDIQAAVMRQFGELIARDQIAELARQLDENYLLESDRFREFHRALQAEFKSASLRKAAHAGLTYQADAAALAEELGSYFLAEGGPGQPNHNGAAGTLKAAIAPHIDFRRGGWCFAWAYKDVAEFCDADLFLIFGTAHAPMETIFALTEKDYDTPFGPLETDRAFIADLLSHYPQDGPNLFQDEFAHRTEHSIEFQAIFLQHIFGARKKIKAVPILCGSLHELILKGISPKDDPHFSGFMAALKQAIARAEQRGQRICLIAGADLAHVGLKFGDPTPTTDPILAQLAVEDGQMLAHVQNLNPEGFYQFIQQEKDKRRICGYPPIYALLNVLQAKEGRLLKYGQRTDDGSTVTFVSMTFY